MVKVLILHQHFNTPDQGGSIRSYYLAQALLRHGIQPVVITGFNEKIYKQENYEGIEVHYLPVVYENAFGFAARSLSFLKFVRQSVRLAKKIPALDICYAISTPLTVGLAGIWLKRKIKLPFIFEVGDLWPDAPVQMGFIKNYFFAAVLYQLETLIYRHAESIVALSYPIKDAIERKISGKKIHLIPNMADCDFYKPKPLESSPGEFGEGKFVVSYIGTAGVANGLDYFIDCANASRKAGLTIHFILCGDGAVLPHLKTSAKRLGLENISFMGLVNRSRVKEIMDSSDAVFVCYKNIPVLQTGSPNKYFDGLAAGKMIIVNFGGWIKTEIEKNGCGLYVNPMEPLEFVTKMEPFVHDKSKTTSFQRAARALAESNYDRKKLSNQFAGIFVS